MLLSGDQAKVRAYFATHTHLLTKKGVSVPVRFGRMQIRRDRDADVGDYTELEVQAFSRVGLREPIALHYDAVLHRVINQRALVFNRSARLIGIIRFSLADKRARPLALPGRPL